MKIIQKTEQNEYTFLLQKERQIIGNCVFLRKQDDYYLQKISVDPGWRGKGYGSFLLRQALKETGGFEKTGRSCHVAEMPQSEAEKRLLEKFGFKPGTGNYRRLRAADLTAVQFLQQNLSLLVPKGGFCVDATCGNGGDTEFLCRLVGSEGRVLAVDIQQQAVKNTEKRMAEQGFSDICRVICENHANLARLAEAGTADCVMFNFGYLPGADHSLFSKAESSLKAVEQALEILKPGGVLAVCLYSGGPNGTEEKDEVLKYLTDLPLAKYTVIQCRFANWADTAPLPVLVLKRISN